MGFYEWQRIGKGKVPHLRTVAGVDLFGMAGLWDRWAGPDGELLSFTVITTTPNTVATQVHDRMPVIINPDDYDAWLDPETPLGQVLKMVRPFSGDMQAVPVSTLVNSPANDLEECVRPTPGAK